MRGFGRNPARPGGEALAMGVRGIEGLNDFPVQIVQDLITRATRMNPRSPKEEIARWFDSKPPFGSWFTRGEQATVSANTNNVELTAFVIPHACYGVLRFFAHACQLVTDYPNITFRVQIDNIPIEGFASIIGPMSPAITAPIPMMDPLLPGQRVSVIASNSSAANILGVQAFLRGWFWHIGPRGDDDAPFSGGS